MATAALLVIAAGRGCRGALMALAIFAAVDQGLYGLSYAVYADTADLKQFVDSAHVPPNRTDRVALDPSLGRDGSLRAGNRSLIAGVSRLDGYAGLEPARRLDYRKESSLRVAGVHWVRREAVMEAQPYDSTSGEEWTEIHSPLPRARLVTKALTSAAADLSHIDVDHVALTDMPLDLPNAEPGAVRIVNDNPGMIGLSTTAPARQLLVLTESFHSGWRATSDGEPLDVLRVNGDFLGCVVPPGTHAVVFTFRPLSLTAGWWISTITFALACTWLAWRLKEE
jgi:hypothetical protein